MASGDVLSISNRALLAVGARAQISSVFPSDGSEEGNAIAVLWTPTFEQLARSAPWNCLTKQVTLSLIQAASGTPENPDGTSYPLPPTPWLYTYAYPSDCLDFRYIVPSFPANEGSTTPSTTINNSAGTWLPTGGQIPFSVTTLYESAGNQPQTSSIVILTNQDQAQGIYVVKGLSLRREPWMVTKASLRWIIYLIGCKPVLVGKVGVRVGV